MTTDFADYEKFYDRFRVPGGKFLHEEPPYIQTLVAQAAVDAQALADVRALDEFLTGGGRIDLACISGKYDLELFGKDGAFEAAYTEGSLDAVRAKAAAWVRGLK